jgi:penicillin-binding protein 1B
MAMKKDRKKAQKRSIWLRLGLYLFTIIILLGLGLILYCWTLSFDIQKRFSGRRWSIPSIVYSDSTLIYPGQRLNIRLFREKLKRLGYRKVDHRPKKKGEMLSTSEFLEIFLHDLDIPSQKRRGFPIRIIFLEDEIDTIKNLKDDEFIPILELEPEELMRFFGTEREQRNLVSIETIPDHVVNAVIAAEDIRFYSHRGLDPRGIFRAFLVNLRHGSIRQGGSTITQQLAKNYFLTHDRTLSRKIKEMFMSITMEFMYTKDEILEIYLNEIYLGQKESIAINGIGEASNFYFNKEVNDLNISEAATIAGLIRAPNLYSPYVNAERCLARRDVVLQVMEDQDWISPEELITALKFPMEASGDRYYHRKAPYFLDYLSIQLEELYSAESLESLGLSIYTTLDSQIQNAAETALEKGLARMEQNNPDLKSEDLEHRLQGALIVMQPKTGYILAMAGGRDYTVSQFNRITSARRQPGSAFKPFIYVSGLDKFHGASILSNELQEMYNRDGTVWKPKNFSPIEVDHLTLREALARSVNLPTVNFALEVGLDKIVEKVRAFGFSTPMDPYPSIALGAFEVIPLELARAYCVFASNGLLPYPLSLKTVVDEDGQTLEQKHMSIERVISLQKAYMMTSFLRSVVEEGTGQGLKGWNISFPVGAKTGTTNGFKDAWFVGFTPDILALVWVGFDDGSPMYGTGSSAALPIWAELINALPQVISGEWFKMPDGIVEKTVCPDSGKLAIEKRCPNPVEEVFLEENVPLEECNIHKGFSPFRDIIKGIKDGY